MNTKNAFLVILFLLPCLARGGSFSDSSWFKINQAMGVATGYLFYSAHKLPDDRLQYYETLGRDLQIELEIPEKYRVPIRDIRQQRVFSFLKKLTQYRFFSPLRSLVDVAGVTWPDAIYLDIEYLDTVSYGMKRFILYHEILHHFFHDVTKMPFLYTAALSTCYHFFHPKKLLHMNREGLINNIVPLSLASLLALYHHFIESRADNSAAYACNCYHCILEAAEEHEPSADFSWFEKLQGYLSKEKLQKIGDQLKFKQALCFYHAGK